MKPRRSAASPATRPSISARSQSRRSVATWSLRERPVCSRLPASPTSAVRRFSTLKWTSSRSRDQGNSPRAISPRIVFIPRSIAARSSRSEHAHRGQHPRVGQRAGDVGIGKPAIEVHRRRVALDAIGDGLAEAPGPSARGGIVVSRLRVGHGNRIGCRAGRMGAARNPVCRSPARKSGLRAAVRLASPSGVVDNSR